MELTAAHEGWRERKEGEAVTSRSQELDGREGDASRGEWGYSRRAKREVRRPDTSSERRQTSFAERFRAGSARHYPFPSLRGPSGRVSWEIIAKGSPREDDYDKRVGDTVLWQVKIKRKKRRRRKIYKASINGV